MKKANRGCELAECLVVSYEARMRQHSICHLLKPIPVVESLLRRHFLGRSWSRLTAMTTRLGGRRTSAPVGCLKTISNLTALMT